MYDVVSETLEVGDPCSSVFRKGDHKAVDSDDGRSSGTCSAFLLPRPVPASRRAELGQGATSFDVHKGAAPQAGDPLPGNADAPRRRADVRVPDQRDICGAERRVVRTLGPSGLKGLGSFGEPKLGLGPVELPTPGSLPVQA